MHCFKGLRISLSDEMILVVSINGHPASYIYPSIPHDDVLGAQ